MSGVIARCGRGGPGALVAGAAATRQKGERRQKGQAELSHGGRHRSPGEPTYDAWACRWLSRWLTEASNPSIGQAADIAGMLADLPLEPQMMEGLLGMLRAPLAPYSTRCAAAYWGTPTTRSTETPASAGLLSP